MTFAFRTFISILISCVFITAGFAQTSAPTATGPAPGAQSKQPPEGNPPTTQGEGTQPQQAQAPAHTLTSEEIVKEEEKQRALGVVPMFGMTYHYNAPPLTSKQKFRLMIKSATDPFIFVAVGIQAGLSQAQDNFAEYGQGAEGYGKRYGAALADQTDSNFFSNFFYPVLFKQDPRYFRLGEGTKKHRIAQALEQEFVARKDSGGTTFHFSNVLGALTAGSISNAYYPQNDRGLGLTMSRAAIALGYGCLGNVLLEFWPDIDHRLFHRQDKRVDPNQRVGDSP